MTPEEFADELAEVAATFKATVEEMERQGREQLGALRLANRQTQDAAAAAQQSLEQLVKQSRLVVEKGGQMLTAYQQAIGALEGHFGRAAQAAGQAHVEGLARAFAERAEERLLAATEQAAQLEARVLRRLDRRWVAMVATSAAAVALVVGALLVAVPVVSDSQAIRAERNAAIEHLEELRRQVGPARAAAAARAVVERSARVATPAAPGAAR